jgi:hypothetical protein
MRPLFEGGTRIYVPITHHKTKEKVLIGKLTEAPILNIYHEAGYHLRQIIIQRYRTSVSGVRMIVEAGSKETEIKRLILDNLGNVENEDLIPNPF